MVRSQVIPSNLLKPDPVASSDCAPKGDAPRRKRAVRTEGALSAVRELIVRERWKPGQQLPKRLDLRRRIGVSMATLQSAIDQLLADGFLKVEPTKGTFVHPSPPHLNQLAVAFTFQLVDDHPSRWVAAFRRLAANPASIQPYRLSIYQGVRPDYPGIDYLKLVDDVREHRVAGILFGNSPTMLVGTPLLEPSDLPLVAVQGSEQVLPSFIPRICTDRDRWLIRALEHLASRRCRRPAILWFGMPVPSHQRLLPRALERLGLSMRPTWMQSASSWSAECAAALVHLLLDQPRDHRPDCLVVADEHLLEGVLHGISRVGLSAGDELPMVVHATFPIEDDRFSGTPGVDRLGFGVQPIVRTATELMNDWRAGKRRPRNVLIQPHFSFEIAHETGVPTTHQAVAAS